MGLRIVFALILLTSHSSGSLLLPHLHQPFLQRVLYIGNNYFNTIAETMLATAKNAISNCAGATAEVASKMAEHSYTALRLKRNAEHDLQSALRTVKNIVRDYESVEHKLNSKLKYYFVDSNDSVRSGFRQANRDLIKSILAIAVHSTPIMRHATDIFLGQMLQLSNIFMHGIEDCFVQAEQSAEANVNQLAQSVSQVTNSVNQDLSKIESYYCGTGPSGAPGSDSNCAGGTVENLIRRVRKDVISVGLNLPTTAFSFTNIGSKVSVCVKDKFYTAKTGVDALAVKLNRILQGLGHCDGLQVNGILKS